MNKRGRKIEFDDEYHRVTREKMRAYRAKWKREKHGEEEA